MSRRFQSVMVRNEKSRANRLCLPPCYQQNAYFLILLTPASPIRPKPRRSMVAGSGTCVEVGGDVASELKAKSESFLRPPSEWIAVKVSELIELLPKGLVTFHAAAPPSRFASLLNDVAEPCPVQLELLAPVAVNV